MFPNVATLYAVGLEDADYRHEKIDCQCSLARQPLALLAREVCLMSGALRCGLCIDWDSVYGFNFAPIKALALQEPLVDTVEKENVVTNACVLKVAPRGVTIVLTQFCSFSASTLRLCDLRNSTLKLPILSRLLPGFHSVHLEHRCCCFEVPSAATLFMHW